MSIIIHSYRDEDIPKRCMVVQGPKSRKKSKIELMNASADVSHHVNSIVCLMVFIGGASFKILPPGSFVPWPSEGGCLLTPVV